MWLLDWLFGKRKELEQQYEKYSFPEVPNETKGVEKTVPMTLGQLQKRFSQKVAKLITWAYNNGYEISFGQAYRSEAQAEVYAKEKKGIANSLHTDRLAVDLNLFKDGKYLANSEDHKPLGEYWKSLSEEGVECAWGGDFKKPDGNHYSIAYLGRR